MPSITDKIHNLAISAKMDMAKPTALYLGHTEHKELLKYIQDNPHVTKLGRGDKFQFGGMWVYEVDAENHMDVGNYSVLS